MCLPHSLMDILNETLEVFLMYTIFDFHTRALVYACQVH